MELSEPNGLIFAREIASYGWRVAGGFVTKDGEKVPCWGDWTKNATTDFSELEKRWLEKRYLWPGVVSGVNSCIVVDCDGPSAVKWFRELATEVGWTKGGLCYLTPGKGGGAHFLWDWPDWIKKDFRQAKVKLEDGGEIQVRGNGHWTLLCGARRPDGVYTIIEAPEEGMSREAPEKLIRAILKEAQVEVYTPNSNVSGDLSEVSPEQAWGLAPLTDGRKNTLAGLSWFLAIRGYSLEDIVYITTRFGEECCVPPLTEETCRKKSEYAFQRATKYREQEQKQAEQSLSYLLG